MFAFDCRHKDETPSLRGLFEAILRGSPKTRLHSLKKIVEIALSGDEKEAERAAKFLHSFSQNFFRRGGSWQLFKFCIFSPHRVEINLSNSDY